VIGVIGVIDIAMWVERPRRHMLERRQARDFAEGATSPNARPRQAALGTDGEGRR
jgi:hypothetical protein